MRPETLIVFDGQSFNNQPRASFPTDKPFNVRAVATLAAEGVRVGMVNTGVNGASYTTRATSVVSRVDQHFPRWASSALVDFSGPSDLLEDKTAAEILALAEANADARRAAGADKILVSTVTPSSVTFSAPQETERVAYNALLRANAAGKFDAVIDIDALPHAADSTDVAYYFDGLHPTNALAAEFAELTVDALRAVNIV